MDSNLKPAGKRPFPVFTVLIAILLVALLVLWLTAGGEDKRIDFSQFQNELAAENVRAISAVGTTVYGLYVNDSSVEDVKDFSDKKFDFYFTTTDHAMIQDVIDKYYAGTLNGQTGIPAQVITTSYAPTPPNIWNTLLPLLYILVLVIGVIIVLRIISKANGKSMDFGKNRARIESNIKVTFNDVAGADEEKQEMQEIVEFLRNPKKFTDLGARIPKGVLLVGPPGTGKTLLAKAIAGEANVPFFSITGSDFVEMFVGVGAARVRDLFEQARRNMPCLVFIDEIDAVGRQRGTGLGNTNDEREQTLNQLLVQMDGFESKDGIVILAATNRADVLDPALLRAGRFDRRISVMRPDVKGREKILRLHAKNKPIDETVNFESMARRMSGFTGADIESVLNEAAILAARDNRPVITQKDVNEGISKTMLGPQKRSLVVTDDSKKRTAYHEAGHAIIAKLAKNLKNDVQEVSIISRGMALGYTSSSPLEDNMTYSREMLFEELDHCMGGRAAEQIVFGQLNTGAANDIKQATQIARAMVTEYGMSDKLGAVSFEGDHEIFIGRNYQTHTTYSETTASQIDNEVKRFIDESLARTIKTLKEKRTLLDSMVEVLLAKETIYSEEVDMIMSGKAAKAVIKLIDKKDKEQEEAFLAAREKKAQKEKEMLEELRKTAIAAFNSANVAAGVALEDSKKLAEESKAAHVEQAEQTESFNADTPEEPAGENEKVTVLEKGQIKKKNPAKEKASIDKKEDGDQTK